jgi:hypothetical protein
MLITCVPAACSFNAQTASRPSTNVVVFRRTNAYVDLSCYVECRGARVDRKGLLAWLPGPTLPLLWVVAVAAIFDVELSPSCSGVLLNNCNQNGLFFFLTK